MPSSVRFRCYQCSRTFTLEEPLPIQPSCPLCNSEFVELLEGPSSTRPIEEQRPVYRDGGILFQRFPGGFVIGGGRMQAPSLIHLTTNAPFPFPGLSLQEMIRFVVNPESFPPDHSIWRNIGLSGDPSDYIFNETDFQNLLSRLMEQSGGRAVGLTEEQMEELQRVMVENVEDGKGCAICQEGYKEGEESVLLSCGHQFHADCVIPWLRRVASCPICRHDPLKPANPSPNPN